MNVRLGPLYPSMQYFTFINNTFDFVVQFSNVQITCRTLQFYLDYIYYPDFLGWGCAFLGPICVIAINKIYSRNILEIEM